MSEEDYFSDDIVDTAPPKNQPVATRKRSVEPQPSQVASLSSCPHLRNQTASSDIVDLTMIDDTSDGEWSEMRDRLPEPSQGTSTATGYAQVVMDAQGAPARIRRSVDPENPRNSMQEDSPNRAAASASTDSVLDNMPLTNALKIKFLLSARREFQSERPSFVRMDKKEAAETVTLADEKGFPQNGALATLVTRKWDSQTSFYTLDRNGETLIDKPYGRKSIYGNQGGIQYSTWSGRGNVWELVPVAYSLNEDNEDLPNTRKDVENDISSDLDNKPHRKFDSLAGGTSRRVWALQGRSVMGQKLGANIYGDFYYPHISQKQAGFAYSVGAPLSSGDVRKFRTRDFVYLLNSSCQYFPILSSQCQSVYFPPITQDLNNIEALLSRNSIWPQYEASEGERKGGGL